MSETSVIVWDLETVPDLKAAALMFGMEGKPDDEVREALGSGSQPPRTRRRPKKLPSGSSGFG